MFERIAIANRGEIAVRIVRTCRELGIRCAVLHSDADKDSLAVRMADEAINLGDVWSYLDVERIVEAARDWGADAIHPGYGFLAENPQFARRCAEAGVVFIGPDADVMEHLGQKDRARASAIELGIPCLPGTEAAVENVDAALAAAETARYPVLIKAVAGGGGRGMRIANNADELREQLPRAMSEAEAAFSSPAVYVEKFLAGARHIEVQVLADRDGNVVHLGERDCTIQRRHQKLIEEAPSPALSDETRIAVTSAATRLLKRLGYVNAGTVEFLVDDEGNYYFLEVNTRIQVEHPVTELLYGIDLIATQIRIAAGEPLPWRQDELISSGWALECRINAEDATRGFMPRPGLVTSYLPPSGPGVRVDSAAFPGWTIPPFYDSMIAKVIVWAPDRETALNRMSRALHEFEVEGVPTTIPFHLGVLDHGDFKSAQFATDFVDNHITPADFIESEAHVRSRERAASVPAEAAQTASPPAGTADARDNIDQSAKSVDRRRIAAITAAVAATMDGPHRIVSVTPQPAARVSADNLWGAAARLELIQRRSSMIAPRRDRRN